MTLILEQDSTSNDFTAKEFFVGILRHWLLITLLIALALAGTTLFYMGYKPTYTSTARILLEDRNSALTNLSAANTGSVQAQARDEARIISNQVQYLKSLDLARGVDNIVNFGKITEFTDAVNKGPTDVFGHFAKNLKIGVAPQSNVIEISYTAAEPELAAKMVNVITNVYKKLKSAENSETNSDASNWLAIKVKELQEKQRAADAKVVDYRINNGIFEGQNNTKLLSEQLTALNASMVAASSQRAEIVARADLINRLLGRNGNLDSARDVLSSAVIQQYRQQILTLQGRRAELSETLLPSHPRLRSVNAELTNVQNQVRAEASNIMLSLRNEVEISIQRENSLKAELNGLKMAEAASLIQEVELNALKREAAANRTLLDSYLAKYREADVRNKTDFNSSVVHVISPAVAPLKPSSISRSSIFAIMGVVGMLIGFVIATIRTLNRKPKTQKKNSKTKNVKNMKTKVEAPNKPIENTGKIGFDDLSFMAAIPLSTLSNRNNNKLKNDILAHLDSDYANGFIDLTDNLMMQSDADFQKHFMVSGIEDESESYEAIMNLGRILDMKGARVLIMDLDADSRMYSKSMVVESGYGFSDVINGKCYFEDCVIKDNKSNADILLAGTDITEIDELIASAEMEEFLDDLDQIYDVILVHSNNVQQQHITAFIDGQIDMTLLVADWEDRAAAKLENALVALKDYQGSEFGLVLMGTNMDEFEREVDR